MARYSEFIAIKLSPDLAAQIRQIARREDRSVSAVCRRLLTVAVAECTPEPREHREAAAG